MKAAWTIARREFNDRLKAVKVLSPADNVVMFRVSPGLNGYTTERSKQLFERLDRPALKPLPAPLMTMTLMSLLTSAALSAWKSSARRGWRGRALPPKTCGISLIRSLPLKRLVKAPAWD